MTLDKQTKPPTTIYTALTAKEIEQLDRLVVFRELEPGDFLFHQYSPAASVYMLDTGMLMIERSSSTGRRQVLAFMQRGNLIGIPHNKHYDFTVSALRASRIREIPLRQFTQLQEEITQLKDNVREIGGNILAHALDQVFALGQKRAHERLSFLLKQLSDRLPPQQCHIIELSMSRQDIADYLGLTIETVSRAFGKLKTEGSIFVHSIHTIEILDMDAIEEMALAD